MCTIVKNYIIHVLEEYLKFFCFGDLSIQSFSHGYLFYTFYNSSLFIHFIAHMFKCWPLRAFSSASVPI